MEDNIITTFRKQEVGKINSEVETSDEQKERVRLEAKYGQVWDTKQLQEDFKVSSFMAPYCSVIRKSDNKRGIISFQHLPRFYFEFVGE
jgi:hypothetical protein